MILLKSGTLLQRTASWRSGGSAPQKHLDRARASRTEGRWEDVFEQAAAALSSDGAPTDWLTFAMECRDQKHASAAQRVFRLLIEKRPAFVPAYYEFAFLFRLNGEHRKAAALLQAALKHDPTPFRTRLFLAHMLIAQGAHPEARASLSAAAAASENDRQALDRMFAFSLYVEENPLGRTLALHDLLRTRRTWLDSRQLAEEILSAIGARRPFAFVRFGDGEGGVLRLDPLDDARHRALYDQNRQELIAMWFGQAFDWRTNGFFELAKDLMAAAADCDVIGIPYESWVEHEYRISSLRGIPSLANVFHALLAAPTHANQKICSQLCHVDLARNGDLARIIQQAGAISVISCLEGLVGMLKERFGLTDVVFHRIPGEQGSRGILGETASAGVHYPDRFNQLMAELARPHAGRVFLIAGGLLGKLYAFQIRRHGGIALDIGSIVDSWLGHATRPGYEVPLAL